ncbi:hypothetical protein CHS0354_004484 [Potamilus streckersoni]|uniref:Nucleoporin NUP42 n=1 Tax=Potamilus streckersoni TaxID=2493646 RepID=A0AAE0SNU3_9BIVA|nr:hypothetical protein CHS0354_004484 [Potamilus streckersoni]
MVVCKFFLNGTCRYGNKCWNEHPTGGNAGYMLTTQRQLYGHGGGGGGGGYRGGGGGGGGGRKQISFRDSFGQNQNPYKWIAPDASQKGQGSSSAAQGTLSSAEIVSRLASEMEVWENSKMWPFSSMAYEKETPCIPGFTDLSPEELRLEAYEAQATGNTQAYIQKFASLVNEFMIKRNELKNPTPTCRQSLISFIEDCKRQESESSGNGQVSLFSSSLSTSSSPFGVGSGNTGDTQVLFGKPTPYSFSSLGLFGKPASTFGQLSSTFGEQQNSFGQQSNFGQSSIGQSTFGQTSVQAYSTSSPFSTPTTLSTSGLFGKGPSTGATSFSSQEPKTGLFGSGNTGFGSPFGSQQTQNSTVFGGSLFGSPFLSQGQASGNTSGFEIQGAQGGVQESSLYTPMDQLTEDEKEQYVSPTFSLGRIPTRPPPRELCF